MQRRNSLLWRVVALLLALVLVAAACGGGDDDGDEEGAAPGGEAQEVEGGAADPDGVIRLGYDLVGAAKGPFTWDPTEVTTQLTDSGLYYFVYGLLLRPTQSGELVPDLAERTEVVDANTIEVTLREGLTFSDGSPFDAAAVKAGLERNLAKTDSTGYATAFFDLQSIEAVDATTVRLSVPNGTAAAWHDTFLASWETTIVKEGTDFAKPVGAGPLMVEAYVKETSIKLVKNPAYWDADSVTVGGIDVIQASDASAGANALAAGQIDMALLDPQTIAQIGSGNDYLAIPNPNTLMTLMVCKREEPLSDPLVRQALNKALDRDAINEAAFEGTYQPAHGLWPEGHRFHDPSVEEAVAYDPEGAKELLAEAGYADGLSFDIYVIQSGGMPVVTEIMQQQFAAIGVKANLIPAQNYVADFLGSGKPGAGAVPTMSPNRLKLLQWSGESIGNTCGYQDPELEDLQAQLSAVSDASDEAVEIWHQLEELAVAEKSLSVFILFGSSVVGYSDELGDAAVMPYTIAVPDIRSTFVKAG